MKFPQRVYPGFDKDLLRSAEILLETLLPGKFNEDKISVYGVNRELQEIDPTMPGRNAKTPELYTRSNFSGKTQS